MVKKETRVVKIIIGIRYNVDVIIELLFDNSLSLAIKKFQLSIFQKIQICTWISLYV